VDRFPISDPCDRHKFHPTLFCQWQKAFFEEAQPLGVGGSLFKVAALEGKLRSKTEVLA
jgi:hypothetical protein